MLSATKVLEGLKTLREVREVSLNLASGDPARKLKEFFDARERYLQACLLFNRTP
jgi:hypothetical protein